ncbi:MAG: hypothetical protein WCT33_00825 [Patescibacteria group bacterium]|jgi:hypothetical protein
MTKRVFVQGDRDPGVDLSACALKTAQLLKQSGWEANVGAYGGLVRIFEESGMRCHAHVMAPRGREVQFSDCIVSVTDCNQLVRSLPANIRWGGEADQILTWGLRLSVWMAHSDAFIFFAGREGTMAHLVPILAWNRKVLAKEGRAKKVVLIGWDKLQRDALYTLGLITIPEGDWASDDAEWFRTYSMYNVEGAVNFLTEE